MALNNMTAYQLTFLPQMVSSFTNHADKMGWMGGVSNVHECQCYVSWGLLNIHIEKFREQNEKETEI